MVCVKEHGPYPVVVRQQLKGLQWSAMVLFLFQKYLYAVCMDDVLEVNPHVGNRKIEQ